MIKKELDFGWGIFFLIFLGVLWLVYYSYLNSTGQIGRDYITEIKHLKYDTIKCYTSKYGDGSCSCIYYSELNEKFSFYYNPVRRCSIPEGDYNITYYKTSSFFNSYRITNFN